MITHFQRNHFALFKSMGCFAHRPHQLPALGLEVDGVQHQVRIADGRRGIIGRAKKQLDFRLGCREGARIGPPSRIHRAGAEIIGRQVRVDAVMRDPLLQVGEQVRQDTHELKAVIGLGVGAALGPRT